MAFHICYFYDAMRTMIIFGLLLCWHFSGAQWLPPIGAWRDHAPLSQVNHIESIDGNIWVGTRGGIYRYAITDKSFHFFSRSTGLSDVGIVHTAVDAASGKILAVYANSNLDLIENDRVRNIPDVLLSKVQGDKTIRGVTWIGGDAFLSSGIGIIVVNPNQYEIRGTYRLGTNGQAIPVSSTALYNGRIFAATAEGLKSAAYPSTQLNDFRNWKNEPTEVLFTGTEQLLTWNNRLIVRKADTVLVSENNRWLHWPNLPTGILHMGTSAGKIYFAFKQGSQQGYAVYSTLVASPTLISSPRMADPYTCWIEGSAYWLGDSKRGVIVLQNGNSTVLETGRPSGLSWGFGIAEPDRIALVSGWPTPWMRAAGPAAGRYVFENEQWTSSTSLNVPALENFTNLHSLVRDPATGDYFISSYGKGLLQWDKNDKLTLYAANSPIAAAAGSPNEYRVAGMAFDNNLNLWIANPGTLENLLVRKKDASWKKFIVPFTQTNYAITRIATDGNRKWIVSESDGVFCFDDGGTIDQTSDDRWRQFRQGLGRGNLPSSSARCVAIDRNGFAWIGTNKGLAIVQCVDELFTNPSCEAILPVVQQDNFAGLLLSEETINDIQVDGADRKWVATHNGVWLLSADAQKVIYRFDTKNSPLLSDSVRSVLIEPKSGEVFFMTEQGIVSFRSTATAPAEEKTKPFVFPNPVPSGFNGTIAIRNLPENAWVRIVELNGRLVHQTRSLGGQAIWNGKNYKGERASSGTYLIFVSNEDNTFQVAGKIFFIN
ncbi:MAG: hypothetical protein FJX83_05165 [Bacteroidetes bacterium]|nr:hypothetical protein [Bacteroidota bacterium]